jgi:hypothetical protein
LARAASTELLPAQSEARVMQSKQRLPYYYKSKTRKKERKKIIIHQLKSSFLLTLVTNVETRSSDLIYFYIRNLSSNKPTEVKKLMAFNTNHIR